ncbi:hypothetical protein [Dactylosporangium cerinum]
MRHLAALHAALRAGTPAEEVLRSVCDRAALTLPAATVLVLDATGHVRAASLTRPGRPEMDGTLNGTLDRTLDGIVATVAGAAVRTGRPVRRGPVCCVPLPGQAGVPGALVAAGHRRPPHPRRLEAFAAVAALALGTDAPGRPASVSSSPGSCTTRWCRPCTASASAPAPRRSCCTGIRPTRRRPSPGSRRRPAPG